jgi:hypothetical protein
MMTMLDRLHILYAARDRAEEAALRAVTRRYAGRIRLAAEKYRRANDNFVEEWR